jgi:TIR domain
VTRYRVFISYSHDERKLAQRIAVQLDANGMLSLWDKDIAPGHGFHDQIKTFISYAHVFLPIITESSSARGWVQQEIGYAMALNIPVLPIALGKPPGEMLSGLQAIRLEHAEADIPPSLCVATIDRLMCKQKDSTSTLYHCADHHEQRTKMISEYAEEVRLLGYTGVVRQSGALSAFHIPDKPANHPIWAKRYGGKSKGIYHNELLRQERISLEHHAAREGCRLIVCPEVTFEEYPPEARVTRLTGLLEFLQAMPDDKIEIARGPVLAQGESFLMVGDWFSASSISGQLTRGYRQTIFTRHAPTLRNQLLRFEDEFRDATQARPWPSAKSSRLGAILYLQDLISRLEAK